MSARSCHRMITTGDNTPGQIHTDICIVGSGPAGMTVALELERQGIDCVLLESGDRMPDQAHTALNETPQIGIRTDPSVTNRVRGLGGTSALWGGLCRRLDAVDMERRDWVPGSGWPIGLNDLLPHYDTAHRILELPPAEYDLARLRSSGADKGPLLEDRDFQNAVFYYDSSPVRFGPRYGPQLESSTRIRTFLDSTVIDIVTDDTGARVIALEVSTLQGKRFQVVAQRFVLAAGAIQTARLLLNANGVHTAGLGNNHDMVGRNFLQHPVFYGPRLLMFNAAAKQRLRRTNTSKVAILTAINPRAASEQELLNFHFFVMEQQAPGEREALLRALPAIVRRALQGVPAARVGEVGEVPEYMHDLESLLTQQANPQTLYAPLEVRAEQAPNRDSRIMLAEERDQLGLRRAVMDWRLNELDRTSMKNGMRLLGGSIARNGIGRVQSGPEQWSIPEAGGKFLHGGNHQYGTTRMGDSPRSSVVNRDCRVHGLANLYIAGSAVFPTTGYANPTLTIVAIAARLAAHLAQSQPRA
ncbi:6'''-hydroxyparomomycin C oxidase [Halioglobus japonicus]|nr:6'''-hydroxyparomomycin C oxidase [Halioglobus japonicus]